MDNVMCNGAHIGADGDPSVGIFPTEISVKGPLFDLGVIAEEDRESFIEENREILRVAFETILDEPIAVVFDFEAADEEGS